MLQVVCQSKDDQVTVVGAGVTLHEALAAAEQLKKGMIRLKCHVNVDQSGYTSSSPLLEFAMTLSAVSYCVYCWRLL